MKIPNDPTVGAWFELSLARIVSEDSQHSVSTPNPRGKSSKDS